MGKRILIYAVFLCLGQDLLSQSSKSTVSYQAYFDYNTGYCPSDSQYDKWVDFISSLDTNSEKYLRITMRGTYDMTGKTCSDKYAVRQIADALYNRYDARVYCDGEFWSVGTGCSDFNCGSYSDYMELTLNSTCNCGVSYTIRPGITSANWGGIATETCQSRAMNASQYMQVDIQRVYGSDNLSVYSVVPFDECQNTQPVRVYIENAGINAVSNYMVGYSINGNLQAPVSVSSLLNPDARARITIAGGYTFRPNTNYIFRIWTYNPNGNTDSDPLNDTLVFTYVHAGSPLLPNAGDVTSCGRGKVDISASAADTILWYDKAAGGKLLGIGKTFTTPFLVSTDTFYAESMKFRNGSQTFGTGFNNYTTLSGDPGEYNGCMLRINAKEILNVSGIKVQSVFGNLTPHYKVYVRKGGFAGYEKDSSTWERIFDAELSNGSTYNTIPVNLLLEPGIDYGLYVTTDPSNGEDIWINYGSYAYSNSDILIEGGPAIYGKFGSIGVYTPWTLDMELQYERTCRSNGRQAVIVTVYPKPSGSELLAAPGFKGRYRQGNDQDPDISEPDMQLSYLFTNPASYDNKDYNSTWMIDSISITTSGGVLVPASMYSFTDPGTGGNGHFFFTPDTTLLDSTVTIRVRCKDLGPYFCDTLITRVIHIAPVPKPDFKVLSTICEGSEVYFHNLSTIHSGEMTYMWYFSPTDSSDFFEPIHRFDSFGIYSVRLVATSEPYKITRDTVILVNISSVPRADFEVVNACQGNAVKFINMTTANPGLVNYKWDFGDRTPVSSQASPSHLYTVPNGYKVSLSAELNGCISKSEKNAYLFSRPVADFTAPATPKCEDESLFFLNNSYIYQGKMGALWNFGDGQNSTLFNTPHKYASPGTFTIRLKMVSEFDCVDSMLKTVVIKPAPVVDFVYDRLCSKDSTHFTNLSTEFPNITSSYTWSFNDGVTLTGKHESRKWGSHGPKTARLLSVLSNGCSAVMEKSFDVLLQPEANFSVSDICSGESAVFANKSRIPEGQMDFLWSFGDSSLTTTAVNAQHLYQVAKTKTFVVTLIASTKGGCDDTIRKPVKVNELPNCGFTFAPFTPIGNLTYRFTPANNTYPEYEWFFGEGGSSKNKSPIYQYLYPGSYTLRFRARNTAGCECEQSVKIRVDLSGIDDISNAIFNLYPNPADGSVSIVMEDGQQGQANIYNHLGELVASVSLDGEVHIQTDSFSSGLYLVEVISGDKRAVRPLTIVH